MNYLISEIFYSIQGEGFWAGHPAIFIRFYGCNLNCHFCDTKINSFRVNKAEDIFDRVQRLKTDCKRVVLTGGEPMVQLSKDLSIANMLNGAGYSIHLETNGTFLVPDIIDWITVSPKALNNSWIQRCGEEMKLIYQGQDAEYFLAFKEASVISANQDGFDYYYIQPEFNFLSVPPLSELHQIKLDKMVQFVKDHPDWAVSLQTHKIMGVR